MADKIKTFGHEDMPQGMTDWQVEDMRRKYPETETTQAVDEQISACTTIYPRSRTYEQTHHLHPAPRRRPALSSMPQLIKSVMRHPILRPELFDKFVSRMIALLGAKIKWR
jgi:hypothetical protein